MKRSFGIDLIKNSFKMIVLISSFNLNIASERESLTLQAIKK
jgi:hypothetical protein